MSRDAALPSNSPTEPLRRDPGALFRGMDTPTKIAVGIVAAAVLVFVAHVSYGLTSPFYYGHYGFHGGAYATWARGTLRHHTLLPVMEPGFAPPAPHAYYLHHPIFTHQFVTLTFAIFGQHEWSVRLAALIPSFASMLLLTALAWRWMGPLPGAAAAVTFAILPLDIWYSVNIDQGFPSIAFLLGFFWFYLRWLDSGLWRHGLTALALEACAGCFEWSPYSAALAIFVHASVVGIRRRGRYLKLALLQPLVAVIMPLGAHFLIVWRMGMLDDLLGAYRNRAAAVSYQAFVLRMWEYGQTLFGKPILLVMGIWLLLALARVIRGRARRTDIVGLTFCFALVNHIHWFKVEVITHAYRQLYGLVWAVIAVADLTEDACRMATWVQGRARGRSLVFSVGRALAFVAPLAIIGGTIPTAWAGLLESRLHGGIPGWKVFNPDLRQTVFAERLARITTPADLLYFHTRFLWAPPHRMDWAFYYDRDLRRSTPLRTLASFEPEQRRHAVVILFPGELAGDELLAFGELARRHPVFQVEDLAAIDLRVEARRVEAYRIAPADTRVGGGLRRWLEGPYPMPGLVRDAPSEAKLAARIGQAAVPAGPAVRAAPEVRAVRAVPAAPAVRAVRAVPAAPKVRRRPGE